MGLRSWDVMPLTVVWRLLTTSIEVTARFSSFGSGLADANRPKVKTAKKNEATRANNIVACIERLVRRAAEVLESSEQWLLSMVVFQVSWSLLYLKKDQ